MVCATAVLSASLALTLLRNAAPPSQSFVISPFSLNTALSIVHDGADGTTQKELTDFLLNGCTSDDVTGYYSTLALSVPTTNETGVQFQSANRFYVDDSISLNNEYERHVESHYKAKVESLNLRNGVDAAKHINNCVDDATNGNIKDVVTAEGISGAKSVLVNAVNFLGKWKFPFNPNSKHTRAFKTSYGEQKIDFMSKDMGREQGTVKVSMEQDPNNGFGTVLIMPYKDEKYNFFYLMPKESSDLEKLRIDLTGEKLIKVVKSALHVGGLEIIVPKIKMESNMIGIIDTLMKAGVRSVFNDGANLSKISSQPLKISKLQHKAMIEVAEQGTEAAAVTASVFTLSSMHSAGSTILIDRPFLFGILSNEDILFLGQFNG